MRLTYLVRFPASAHNKAIRRTFNDPLVVDGCSRGVEREIERRETPVPFIFVTVPAYRRSSSCSRRVPAQ